MNKKILSILLIMIIFFTGCTTGAINGKIADRKVDTDTVIVGGGIAGLTSAFFLDKGGKDFILLEKEEVVGGKAINGKKDGLYYAKGTEYIGYPEDNLKVMIDDLGINLLEIPSPMDIHVDNGRKYYGDIGNVLHLVENSSVEEFNEFVGQVLEIYDEYEELPYFDDESSIADLDKLTAGEWFRENDYSQVYYDTYNVTSKGLFGATLEEVSALNVIPEIAFDFIGQVEMKEEYMEELKKMNKPYKERRGSGAYTFEKGISEIPLAIYNKFKHKISLSSLVRKVEKKEDIYYTTYMDLSSNEKKVVKSNNVILAVPSPIVPLLAKDLLTEDQINSLEKIPYASYITLALFTDEYVVNEAFDIAVADGYFFTDIYDSTWVQREYDESVRNEKSSVLSFYIAPESCYSKKIIDMDDEAIIKRVYEDSAIVPGLENIKKYVTGYDIYRIKYAYPVMVPGAYERIQKLHDEMQGSLQLAGDYMVYPTLEGAVESGIIAAKKILLNRDK